jgi:serine/threonine protein kinase
MNDDDPTLIQAGDPSGDADETLVGHHDKLADPDAALAAPGSGARRSAGQFEIIAGYRILGKLGEGGMGAVFEAEQETPRRRVALKISHGGPLVVDELRLKLFEREIQSLGRLVHPNIAAIFDAGRTEDGHHFFAMELVPGETLDAYIDRVGLPRSKPQLKERLGIFRTICNAVHYAHQRGVVHRDLKPANVIVGDDPSGSSDHSVSASNAGLHRNVKVLDFGLARITDSEVAAGTVLSEVGTIRGTLPYMSPEQTKGDPDAIDVRADVYALGIILYEMLTGEKPYDVGNSLLEAARIICEQAPRQLSRASADAMAFDDDLQTIVSKTLEKEPDRRYQSAAALSEDVERFLGRQPILARPPSTMYQLRKAVERNRTVTGLLAVLALAVVGFGFWMSVLYARADREARISKAVNEFLNEDLLASADPRNTPDPNITVREVLGRAAGKIEERFGDRPLVQAAIRDTLGETYLSLGLFDEAETHVARSLSLRRRALGERDPAALRTLSKLGAVHHAMGQEEADEELLRALDQQESLLGANHLDTLATRTALALRHLELGRLDEAEELASSAFEALSEIQGPTHDDTLEAMDVLAVTLLDQGRMDEAEALYDRQLPPLLERYGSDDPRVLTRQVSLGWVYFAQERLEDATAITERALEAERRVFGNEHPDTLVAVNNLGIMYRRAGRPEEAAPLYLEAFEGSRALLGEEHPDTLISMSNVGRLYQTMGRCEEGLPLLSRSVELHREVFADPYIGTGYTLATLGECLIDLGRIAEARITLSDSAQILRATSAANSGRLEEVEKLLSELQ